MKRLSFVTATALVLAASAPLLSMTIAPASAQEWADDEGGDHGGDWRQDRREHLMDMLRERRDRRSELMDMLQERRDRRMDLVDLLRERRDRRDELLDLIRERRGFGEGQCFFSTRSLANEDRDFVIIVRRKICND